MRKLLCIIVAMSFLCLTKAQILVEEEYLQELILNSTIVYCSQDTLADGQIVKKMELMFQDTTIFYSAYLSSEPFIYEATKCDFVRFKDGGEGLSFTKEKLNEFIYLQYKLNYLLRVTDLIVYYEGYVPWWYVE